MKIKLYFTWPLKATSDHFVVIKQNFKHLTPKSERSGDIEVKYKGLMSQRYAREFEVNLLPIGCDIRIQFLTSIKAKLTFDLQGIKNLVHFPAVMKNDLKNQILGYLFT